MRRAGLLRRQKFVSRSLPMRDLTPVRVGPPQSRCRMRALGSDRRSPALRPRLRAAWTGALSCRFRFAARLLIGGRLFVFAMRISFCGSSRVRLPLGRTARVEARSSRIMVNNRVTGGAPSCACAGARNGREPMPLTVQALDHLVVQVSDVDVSAEWYARVLGMTREDVPPEPGKAPRTAMQFGRQKINLRPIAASKEDWFTADHEAAGSEDLCFLTDATPDEVVRAFARCRASPSWPARAEARRARHADVGLLPRSGRQPDRDRVLPRGLKPKVPFGLRLRSVEASPERRAAHSLSLSDQVRSSQSVEQAQFQKSSIRPRRERHAMKLHRPSDHAPPHPLVFTGLAVARVGVCRNSGWRLSGRDRFPSGHAAVRSDRSWPMAAGSSPRHR